MARECDYCWPEVFPEIKNWGGQFHGRKSNITSGQPMETAVRATTVAGGQESADNTGNTG
jgi:hypothetical protein